MTIKNHPGFIGPVDHARRERLLELSSLIGSTEKRTLDLRFPDWHEQQMRDLTDVDSIGLGGPRTVLFGLSDLLADHSLLLRSGVPMVVSNQFVDLDLPVLDRSLEAVFGGASADIGGNGVSAALPKPKRLSAYVTISRQLRVQNELLAGAWLENQLLAAVGRALDKAAIIGDGSGQNPVGILNDPDILSHTRAAAGVDTLADLVAMQKAVADANGEIDPENFIWISDTATRESLQTTEGIGSPIWEGPGPMGHDGIASVHAPAGTLALAQKNSMAIIDWNKLQVENVLDIVQATEGFQTVLISGYYDFHVLDSNGICKSTDPA